MHMGMVDTVSNRMNYKNNYYNCLRNTIHTVFRYRATSYKKNIFIFITKYDDVMYMILYQ